MNTNLITRERAQQCIAAITSASSFTNEENRVLDHVIAAVSDAVRMWCRRDFTAQLYDELYDGTGTREMLLRQYPILSVERVATGLTSVLEVTNTSSSNQRASVQVTGMGLTLIRVASGTVTTDASVTFASNVTLSAVVTAVDALGNGWDARVPDSTYTLWPSADLRATQGALNCKDTWAGLKMHVEELSSYEVDAERGILLHGEDAWAASVAWEDGCGWSRGQKNWRVVYTAGYESVPEAVQEACAQWAAERWYQAKRDPAATSQSVVGAVSSTFGGHGQEMPAQVVGLLRPYRKHTIGGL